MGPPKGGLVAPEFATRYIADFYQFSRLVDLIPS